MMPFMLHLSQIQISNLCNSGDGRKFLRTVDGNMDG
jgi:hypothetical protein